MRAPCRWSVARKVSASNPLSPTACFPRKAGRRGSMAFEVMARSSRQVEGDCPSASIHHGGQLAVEPALGAPNRLAGLAAARVRTVLMQLDVRAIQMPQLPHRFLRDELEHPRPQPARAPPPPTRVNRTPRPKLRRHVTPRTSRPHHIPHRRDHPPVVLRRPPSLPARSGFSPAQLNFLSRLQSGSGKPLRSVNLIAPPLILLPKTSSSAV